MKILQRKLSVRIFLAVIYFIGVLLSLGYGCIFILEDGDSVSVILLFSVGIGAAFLTAGINVLKAKIEYDDEKLISRSFIKEKIIYYKDINFLGRKVGSSTSRSQICYWIIKTRKETIQLDIPVSFQSQEFEDFIEKKNPEITIKKN